MRNNSYNETIVCVAIGLAIILALLIASMFSEWVDYKKTKIQYQILIHTNK